MGKDAASLLPPEGAEPPVERAGEVLRFAPARLALVLAVAALVLGTPTVDFTERMVVAGFYLALALSGLSLSAFRGPLPGLLAGGLDVAAHALVFARMGGAASSFLLLLALPILVWGLARGVPGGLWTAVAALAAEIYTGRLDGTFADGGGVLSLSVARFAFHAAGFLLLGLFAGLLGRRFAEAEARHLRTRRELEVTRLDAESILACLATPLLCADSSGTVRRWNAPAASLFPSELTEERRIAGGIPLAELDLTRVAPLTNHLAQCLEDQSFGTTEITIGEGRDRLLLEVVTAPIRAAGDREGGLTALLSDLTERRRAEEAERRREKLAVVGQLSAGLAHEIRNSLKPITGCVELLLDDLPASPSARDLMEIILREADSLERFLSDFLAFARDKSLQVEALPLERVVEEEALALRAVLRQPLVVAKAQGLDGAVRADRDAVRQILRNLALNAEQADGSHAIEFSAAVDGEDLCLGLRDHGPGIAPEVKSRLFEPFFTTKPRGTGLGLAIARDLAERLGGRLSLENADTGGCLATLRLPLAAPSERAA